MEKPSQLLSKAKELIQSQNLKEALYICEKVINLEPDNVNGLLLATKCWIDLGIKPDNVKYTLEKVLILKPNNPNAVQGLRKFYEKYLNIYLNDAVNFYKQLCVTDSLMEKEWEIITEIMPKLQISEEIENFIWDRLLYRFNTKNHYKSLKTLFKIAAENVIVHRNRNRFDQFEDIIVKINHEEFEESDTIDFLKEMISIFKAFFDGKDPEDFYKLLNENNSTTYSYYLFAQLLCDQYLFSNCQEILDSAFKKLNEEETLQTLSIETSLKIIRIQNLIHWKNTSELTTVWPVDGDLTSKFAWCQAKAIGFDPFGSTNFDINKINADYFSGMAEHEAVISNAIMDPLTSESTDMDKFEILNRSPKMTSFNWYLWAGIMKKQGLIEKQRLSLESGSRCKPPYYGIYVDLADMDIKNDNYKEAVDHLWMALEKHFCPIVLESLVDLHMGHEQYLEPIQILEKLEIENCSESLLEKFIHCLNNLNRITDAISVAQRLAKQYPETGLNWQFLGDLYLKRGNIKSAFTTYSKCLELNGSNSGIYARIGNVFSLQYQETFDENDYFESIDYFQKSLDMEPTIEAIEGKSSVHYLHSERSVKQLMLTSAAKDIQHVIDLLINHKNLLLDSEFVMNLLGKAIFLSMIGSIDKKVLLNKVISLFSTSPSTNVPDSYTLASKCFLTSIEKFPNLAESYFNIGLLTLYKMNCQCSRTERGETSYPNLYSEAGKYLKSALHLNSNHNEAWKYLGYLYFRHGVITARQVFEIQHCLSMAINITSTIDSIKDSESAFLLGLLYVRENWFNLAKEVFSKIQMDYPVNPTGYIGMYLLAAKDHTVLEQSHIAKAILCYNYRDEESSIDDSCYRMNDSLVGLFCENLGFLVQSHYDYESFQCSESNAELISALKNALHNVWIKYSAYKTMGSHMQDDQIKQYREYGCFLGILELLTGNQNCGIQFIRKSNDGNDSSIFSAKLFNLLKLDDCWINKNYEECLEKIRILIDENIPSVNQDLSEGRLSSDQSNESITLSLLESICSYLSSPNSSLSSSLETIISKLSFLTKENDSFQASIILPLGALVLTTKDRSLALLFIKTISSQFPHFQDKIDGFPRILARLKVSDSGAEVGYRYLYDYCLKQPFIMSRWLDLLEFGLEYFEDIKHMTTISKIFFITARPWCFSAFDIERYAKILHRHSQILTTDCTTHHKHMIMQSMKLFPTLCLSFFRTLILK